MHGAGEGLQLSIPDLGPLPSRLQKIRRSVKLEAAIDLLSGKTEGTAWGKVEEGECVAEEFLERKPARPRLKLADGNEIAGESIHDRRVALGRRGRGRCDWLAD